MESAVIVPLAWSCPASVSAVSCEDAVLAVLYQLDVLVLGDASSSNIPVQVPPAPVLMRVMGRCAQY